MRGFCRRMYFFSAQREFLCACDTQNSEKVLLTFIFFEVLLILLGVIYSVFLN